MRKILFPITMGLFSMLFIASCESDMPDFNGEIPVKEANEVNEWIYEDMNDNYLFWTGKNSTDLDFNLQPGDFFKELKNSSDNIASLTKRSDISTETTYDIGFEYGINHYTVDNKTYYVVYYTKEGSSAENNGIKRGDNIISINGTAVPNNIDDAETLLLNAIKNGGTINLAYMRPPASNPVEASITLQTAVAENPVYAVKDTAMNLNTMRVGYLAYNQFSSKSDSETKLKNALTQLKDKNINYFVLDLRYNPGGDLSPIGTLGSALVKSRVAGDPFMVYKRRTEIGDRQISISDDASIPKLGDQLNKIYIITGQYTSSASEAFINALKAYWGNNLILAGEKTVAAANNNIALVFPEYKKENANTWEWKLTIPIGYMADKNGNYDYTDGFTPNISITDINTEKVEKMLPLGSTGERIFKEIIADIKGLRSASLKSVTVTSDGYSIPSSIMSKPWAGKSVVEVE